MKTHLPRNLLPKSVEGGKQTKASISCLDLYTGIADSPVRTGPAVQKLGPVPNFGPVQRPFRQIAPISCQFSIYLDSICFIL